MKWISEGELEALRGFGKSVGEGLEAMGRGASEIAEALDNLAEALREKAGAEDAET